MEKKNTPFANSGQQPKVPSELQKEQYIKQIDQQEKKIALLNAQLNLMLQKQELSDIGTFRQALLIILERIVESNESLAKQLNSISQQIYDSNKLLLKNSQETQEEEQTDAPAADAPEEAPAQEESTEEKKEEVTTQKAEPTPGEQGGQKGPEKKPKKSLFKRKK